jgi:dTDP-4-dehydrorhamnose 3,5-epimerase
VIDLERVADDRGFFARSFCREEFAAHGLEAEVAQCSISFNRHRGTLRGLHYQAAPHAEAKLVRCSAGAIWDVVVDLRPGSPTFKLHFALTLSAAEGRMLYVPPGLAHGFLTVDDATEVAYQMSVPYHAPAARGVRWDDPAFAIPWPAPPLVISERDRAWSDFAPEPAPAAPGGGGRVGGD